MSHMLPFDLQNTNFFKGDVFFIIVQSHILKSVSESNLESYKTYNQRDLRDSIIIF